MFALPFLLSEQIHIRVLFFAYIALSRDNKFLATLFKLCYLSLSIADDTCKTWCKFELSRCIVGLTICRPVKVYRKFQKSKSILNHMEYIFNER